MNTFVFHFACGCIMQLRTFKDFSAAVKDCNAQNEAHHPEEEMGSSQPFAYEHNGYTFFLN